MLRTCSKHITIVAVAALLSVVGTVSAGATGETRPSDTLVAQAHTVTACRSAILGVWDDLLRGGTPWRRDLFALKPLVVGGGAPTAERAASTIARTRGLLPACDVLTVSYAARSLSLVTLFGGPSALAHLRAQWASMSSAQRSVFEQHLFYGQTSSVSLSLGSITILSRGPAAEKLRIKIIEHVAAATTTASATVSVVRLAGRWYVSSFSSLGLNVG